MKQPKFARRPRRADPLTVRAQVQIRDLILGGRLRRGHRISQTAMVERLGMSPTPVRAALRRLEAEGLIAAYPTGGFLVKPLEESDLGDRIELRGLHEGLSARLAAERGVTPGALRPLEECLDAIDEIARRPELGPGDFIEYVELNARFHQLLRQLPGSRIVARQIVRAGAVPFESPAALAAADPAGSARAFLLVAQEHHRAVLDAIAEREGARAESIMREHARFSGRALAPLLDPRVASELIGGASVGRRSSRPRGRASLTRPSPRSAVRPSR